MWTSSSPHVFSVYGWLSELTYFQCFPVICWSYLQTEVSVTLSIGNKQYSSPFSFIFSFLWNHFVDVILWAHWICLVFLRRQQSQYITWGTKRLMDIWGSELISKKETKRQILRRPMTYIYIYIYCDTRLICLILISVRESLYKSLTENN